MKLFVERLYLPPTNVLWRLDMCYALLVQVSLDDVETVLLGASSYAAA